MRLLLAPLFHRAGTGRYATAPDILDELFASLPRALLPGDPLPKGVSYCLTFDDATDDFYRVIYPLLQKHAQRALLAVPTALVGTPGFCTWEELIEMERSGLITCASHTVHHTALQTPSSEIVESKRILSDALGRHSYEFAYLYGAFS